MIPTTACAPWRDGASARCGRSYCACERENHECGSDGADWADTCVSSKILRKLKKIATREPTILMGVAPACQRTVRVCYIRASVSSETDSSDAYGIWSPPKVFHTCAKTCGNSCSLAYE